MAKADYRAALYMRLSKDDDGAAESASITTQRQMLRSYAAEHGYAVYDEYSDDGYSGVSFERPEFRRMIADIEAKRVNLVIVKDLSRLGRDYITAGQYTEIYFPSKGVRCIAVNDGYDSEGPYTDIAPFKNVINEMYARDISKKIRSAFAAKMREGAYVAAFAPYGYQKDAADKNRLVTDARSGEIVKRIFTMAAGGAKPADIAPDAERGRYPLPRRISLHNARRYEYRAAGMDGFNGSQNAAQYGLHRAYGAGENRKGVVKKPREREQSAGRMDNCKKHARGACG